MTAPEIRPATDEEIASRHTRGKSENEYWTFQQQLVARIEGLRAELKKLAPNGDFEGAL